MLAQVRLERREAAIELGPAGRAVGRRREVVREPADLLEPVGVVVVLALRVWDVQNGPPLGPWHTFVPEELDRDAIDRADWTRWVAAEDSLFASVRREVSGRLEPEEQVQTNRYYSLHRYRN